MIIAACHALLRFLSQGIRHVLFGRITLLAPLGVVLGTTPQECFHVKRLLR